MCPCCLLCRQQTAPCLQTSSCHKQQQDLVVSQLQSAFGAGCVPWGVTNSGQKNPNKQKKKKNNRGEMWMKKLCSNMWSLEEEVRCHHVLLKPCHSLIIRFPAGITAEWVFMVGFVAFKMCMRIFFLADMCPLTSISFHLRMSVLPVPFGRRRLAYLG